VYKDPVCGAYVDPDETEWHCKYQGETFYFCCLHCLEAFEMNPLRYISPAMALMEADRDSLPV
jgi:P-type Cu+ transporter